MKAYMCLCCKPSAYNRVLEELLKLNIPRGDMFLLQGPVDILVQFAELHSLDEFVQKWFNPIRMVGAEEALVTKSLTFIVIHQGPSYVDEPFAFLFLNSQPRNLEKLQEALLTVPEVISADTVFGPYDLVCAIKVNNMANMESLISRIQEKIPEIEGTMTAVVASIRI
jgi:DNA-binding Lrp family transcriptional regulator